MSEARQSIPPIDEQTSRTIQIARVLCILSVVYMHAPPYLYKTPSILWSDAASLFLVREIFGRTSVALLSIISGFLCVRLGQGKSTSALGRLQKKVTTLIVPLAIWNTLTFIKMFFDTGYELPALTALPRMILAFDGFPLETPTYFLRDLFVCNLFIAPMVWVVRRAPWSGFVVLFLAMASGFEGPLFLNNAIPVCFFVGLMVAENRLSPLAAVATDPIAAPCIVCGCLVIVVMQAVIKVLWVNIGYNAPEILLNIVEFLARFAGATIVWFSASQLERSTLSWRIAAFEPVIFFVFCSHPFSLGISWVVLQHFGVAFGTPAYFAFLAFCPIICLGAGVAGVAIIRLVAPIPLRWMLGGRVPGLQQMARIVSAMNISKRSA